ncbi:hypothetical protein B0H16DRAFT_1471333 [Mycena metata]|uniref:Uncharacterized protein n=1 Tax=Mycena metata TaxID=1033252 RepID=A0AAD7HRH0_9AGAR|nr:hypothetical protein B0H16DRAFT_1471333 [Mycena metata]
MSIEFASFFVMERCCGPQAQLAHLPSTTLGRKLSSRLPFRRLACCGTSLRPHISFGLNEPLPARFFAFKPMDQVAQKLLSRLRPYCGASAKSIFIQELIDHFTFLSMYRACILLPAGKVCRKVHSSPNIAMRPTDYDLDPARNCRLAGAPELAPHTESRVHVSFLAGSCMSPSKVFTPGVNAALLAIALTDSMWIQVDLSPNCNEIKLTNRLIGIVCLGRPNYARLNQGLEPQVLIQHVQFIQVGVTMSVWIQHSTALRLLELEELLLRWFAVLELELNPFDVQAQTNIHSMFMNSGVLFPSIGACPDIVAFVHYSGSEVQLLTRRTNDPSNVDNPAE